MGKGFGYPDPRVNAWMDKIEILLREVNTLARSTLPAAIKAVEDSTGTRIDDLENQIEDDQDNTDFDAYFIERADGSGYLLDSNDAKIPLRLKTVMRQLLEA